MDGFSLPSQVQVMPRLRITRQSFTMSGAGSSQPSARPGDHVGTLADLGTTYALEDDEDDESTPRRAPTNTLHPLDDVDTGDKSEATPIAETPANRLRALLSRSPGSATPTQRYRSTSATSSKAPTGSGSPGFNFNSSKPLDLTTPKHPFSPPFDEPPMSVARENLRSLFVHALRDPGDTPVKNGQRRRSNSIGSSAVDGTPVKGRAHAKRLSLSDEEADHMSRRDNGDLSLELSQRSSQAAVFDSLRARLSSATLAPVLTSPDSADELDASPPTDDLASFTIPTKASAATMSLQASVSQFPSMYSASNLLGDDSAMRRAIKDLDSDATEDEGNGIPLGSASRKESAPKPYLTQSSLGHKHTRSLSRQVSMESIGSTFSRSSSRQSTHQVANGADENLKERERGWNRPMNAYINGQMSRGLRRSGSTASLMSSDGRTSPTSSVGSSHERSHKAAGLELSATRARTLSQPSLPSSASTVRARKDSLPGRPASSLSQHRLSSLFHSPNSPRASSPALSVSSHVSSREDDVESQHLRERNWNSPRPKWESPSDKQIPRERRRSQTSSPVSALRVERDQNSSSPPTQRITSVSDGSLVQATATTTPAKENPTRVISPAYPANGVPQSPSPVSKRQSISRSPAGIASSSSDTSKIPTPPRRNDWTFPRSKSPNPVSLLENDNETHESLGHVRQRTSSSPAPIPRPNSRTGDNGSLLSLIPVRANGTTHSLQTHPERRSLHKRSVTEFNASVGSIPPRVSFAAEPVVFAGSESDSSLNDDATAGTLNPTEEQPTGISPEGSQESESAPLVSNESEFRVNPSGERFIDMQIPIRSDSNLLPPSPSIMLPGGLVATPKRDRVLNISKAEFLTPSPPRGMPDLPDPPSSSEDVDSDRTPPARALNTTLNARLAAMRTPRPPGAWMTPSATPAVTKRTQTSAAAVPASNLQTQTPLPRNISLVAPTPAPPGAWVATPANLRRRIQQRVRFDKGSTTSGSDNPVDGQTGIKGKHVSNLREGQTVADWHASGGDGESTLDPVTSTPRASPHNSPRSSRHSPKIRLVDAFGKEISPSETKLPGGQESASKLHDGDLGRKDSSLGRKSMLRIVDAMGREVEENSMDLSDKVSANDSANPTDGNQEQTKELIHKTLAELKDDFERMDSTNTSDDFMARIEELEKKSQKARLERESILRRIQSSAGTDEQTAKFATRLLGKYDVNRTNIFSRMNTRLVLFYFIAQIILILVLFRLLSLGARHMFLTTYYDPFYSELYIHITDPHITHLTTATHSLPTNFSSDGAVTHQYQTTWAQLITSSWYNLMDVVFSFRRDELSAWGSSRTMAWTPTRSD